MTWHSFNVLFQHNPHMLVPECLQILDLSEVKDNCVSGDNWRRKNCKAPVKLSPPTNQHRLHVLPVSVTQPTASERRREKASHSTHLLSPSSSGGLPTLSLTIRSSWLACGRVAKPLISPLTPVPQTQQPKQHCLEQSTRRHPCWTRHYALQEDS